MSTNREWLSISDMMSGLMMVFLFIAIAFMVEVDNDRMQAIADKEQAIADKEQADKDKKKVTDIAKTYKESTSALNQALRKEFTIDELQLWGAEILDDNTIRFKEPTTLFGKASAYLKGTFKDTLNDFFGRYVKVLTNQRFKPYVLELRIEGHTSPVGKHADDSPEESYLYNVELSQKRALSVLMYVFKISQVKDDQPWLESVLRANGLSYSQQLASFEKSRRVEFRVIMNTEEKIKQILKLDK